MQIFIAIIGTLLLILIGLILTYSLIEKRRYWKELMEETNICSAEIVKIFEDAGAIETKKFTN